MNELRAPINRLTADMFTNPLHKLTAPQRAILERAVRESGWEAVLQRRVELLEERGQPRNT